MRDLARLIPARMQAGAAALAASALVLWTPSPAAAQQVDDEVPNISRPVVQPLPNMTGMTLNDALGRLGRDPRNVEALIDAGNAALALGDVDAATGFFRRADQIAPGNARVKAGLAGAFVRSGNPFDAMALFAEAEKAGALDTSLAADRGLAYDLVGDNASAQRYYKLALARGPDDEVTRRLALSQAIAGDRRGSELTLTPLLRLQDKAGWRTRAFTLAILGDADQAVSIARTVLPPSLAEAMSPYLRYMPRLTPAQQAAAANFGAFPRASEIGRDDPRVALYAPAGGRRPALASADAKLIPSGEPLGGKRARAERETRRERRAAEQQRAAAARQSQQQVARVAPGEVQPGIVAREPAEPTLTARPTAPARPSPPRVARTLPPAPPPRVAQAGPAPSPPVVAASPARPAASQPATAQRAPAPSTPASSAPSQTAPSQSSPSMSGPVAPSATPLPGFDLASIAARQEGRTTPEPASPPATANRSAAPASPLPAPPARPTSISDAFSDFAKPAAEVSLAPGAVDIRSIAPARARVVKPVRSVPPAHPSRIWVQVATGRDKAALGFDWRRMARQASDAMKGKQSFVTSWGQTNRLLAGPFESERAANAFIAQLRRGGVDGAFLWTSPAGQVVDQLGGK